MVVGGTGTRVSDSHSGETSLPVATRLHSVERTPVTELDSQGRRQGPRGPGTETTVGHDDNG